MPLTLEQQPLHGFLRTIYFSTTTNGTQQKYDNWAMPPHITVLRRRFLKASIFYSHESQATMVLLILHSTIRVEEHARRHRLLSPLLLQVESGHHVIRGDS